MEGNCMPQLVKDESGKDLPQTFTYWNVCTWYSEIGNRISSCTEPLCRSFTFTRPESLKKGISIDHQSMPELCHALA
jgi:hypothetical protein